ncbi:putative histidine kinase group protein [Lasiosphaeria ovina]|uniref:Histidine kinase group protein n=1 Tax=Lasiosphaeria ovina TaxID=92902 RepID=A0AAE0JTB7_9PEZI|nr:putative histidine kinase group protein [Lasiosphaeria ovina]
MPVAASSAVAKKVVKAKAPAQPPSSPALIICRNKHWRYISSFHGPWLQLTPDILESLANTNFNTPRPRPIDPAVFFDLIKIRRLVDEATNLAVRAASGVAAITQQNTSGAPHAALGLGFGYGPSIQTKLSRERKHRMREQATQKLSKAYHLDEIACSVATMQSASPLEEVASLVLQRNPDDSDAKYVHFFHEKIPSRQLAECTNLVALSEIISDRPTTAEPLRTRATVRVFKEDFEGAVSDLTEALRIHRSYRSPHTAPKPQSQELHLSENLQQRNGRWHEDITLKEEDQPSSVEIQLLFQRAGVYLLIACSHVAVAFSDMPTSPQRSNAPDPSSSMTSQPPEGSPTGEEEPDVQPGPWPTSEPQMTAEEKETQRKAFEARKLVKLNAKRALRDYMEYLSHCEYSPDLSLDIAEEFARKVNYAANGVRVPRSHSHPPRSGSPVDDTATSRPHRIYALSDLFTAAPPTDLPPYPSTEMVSICQVHPRSPPSLLQTTTETITYHPLLTDALHSLLLCHCLIQTSAKELLRHAYMVARLTRLADGYPVFQASRSPARADWVEVLRVGGNWIQLVGTWEDLCSPAPLPLFHQSGNGAGPVPVPLSQFLPGAKPAKSTPAPATTDNESIASTESSMILAPGGSGGGTCDDGEKRKERVHQQAILDAIESERANEDSFRLAIRARQLQAERDYHLDNAVASLDSRLMRREIAEGRPAEQVRGPGISVIDVPADLLANALSGKPVEDNADPGTLITAGAAESKPITQTSSSGTNSTKTLANGGGGVASAPPRRWAHDDGRDNYMATDRAAAVARWVSEAPARAGSSLGANADGTRKRKKKPVKRGMTSGASTAAVQSGSKTELGLCETKGGGADTETDIAA